MQKDVTSGVVVRRSLVTSLAVTSLLLVSVAPAPAVPGDSVGHGRGKGEPHSARAFRGVVRADGMPVAGATVDLLHAGTTPGSARVLGRGAVAG
jgi:hypothetical protein